MDDTQQDTTNFLKEFDTMDVIEDKLRASVTFMKEALAQERQPNFKGFWEVRKRCLPLFKESLPGPVRNELWSEYIELTREGRRLKGLMDQETAYAVEQIDLAISSLEEEIKAFHDDLDSALGSTPPIAFPKESKSLEKKISFYEKLQKKLNVLNVFAARVNALRKELIQTEMRIKPKNKFFQRLSTLGDQVFPPRKELIQEISEAFLHDVEQFVEANFSPKTFSHEQARRSVFFFREEIKAIQATAKQLTLNTHTFSQARQQLSECWDKLKGMEKELKVEYAEQKQKSAENVELVRARIQAFTDSYAQGELSIDEANKKLSEITHWMRELELTRNDLRELREALQTAREPLEAKLREKDEKRAAKEAELEKVRRESLDRYQEQLVTLKENIATSEFEQLSQQLESSRKELVNLSVSKAERQVFERTLKEIRDLITSKREEALLALPEGDRAVLENLEEILGERQERRREIKAQIEEYRKILGGSGLDFEKAMRYNEMMSEEKGNLAKIDEGISEIEQKIRTFAQKR